MYACRQVSAKRTFAGVSLSQFSDAATAVLDTKTSKAESIISAAYINKQVMEWWD